MVYDPVYADYANTGHESKYRHFLRRDLKDAGRGVEREYRGALYGSIGRGVENANQMARSYANASFGMNNPSGMLAAMYAQNSQGAQYGMADLAAREAARKAVVRAGTGLQAAKQAQANWYTQLQGLQLTEEGMDQQMQMYGQQMGIQEDAALYNLLGSIIGGGAGVGIAAI